MTGQILLNIILVLIILLTAFLTYNKVIELGEDDKPLDCILFYASLISILILLGQIGHVIFIYWDKPIF
jgi:hypothetical protein